MEMIAFLSLFCTLVFAILYHITRFGIWFTLAVTFGTIAYHFCIRLLIGFLYQWRMNNHADYTKRWYQLHPWEQKLYRWLKVKKWKNKMPTYRKDFFDPKLHSWSEIAQAMCQAELVHETIVVFSFLPLLFSIWVGAFPVFLVTSIAAACFDMIFVVMQRYNRARVIKMLS